VTQLKQGIYWVGAIDWNIRNFHGYITNHGTTYNAYLIIDEKVALVDTVKDSFFPEMVDRIKKIVNPAKINYLISNHTEPDHSGAITKILELTKDAELIASERGMKGLKRYYGADLVCTSIEKKPTVNLGDRTLHFIPVPMVHWPDSMVTYIPEEKLLLSNDAFGQHFATSKRFDDDVDQAVLMDEAKTYYANIVMHLWGPIGRALKALEDVNIEMIAPSHGVVWRSRPEIIIEAYKKWVEGITVPKVVIVYDTMWGSTEMIANAVAYGIINEGVKVQVYKLRNTDHTKIMTDILDAEMILIGSPTLNNGLFPTVASFLTYMHGLKPRKKLGAFFGSYGWGGGAKKTVEHELTTIGIDVIESDLDFNYRPNKSEIQKAVEFGKKMAQKILTT